MQAPHAFTQLAIESLPAGLLGVYGLLNGSHWVYIGAGDIKECLLDLFKNQTPSLTKHAPTLFLIEITNDYGKRLKQLRAELNPIIGTKKEEK